MKRFHLLVAIDETEASRTAVHVAGLIAQALKARITLLHVGQEAPSGDEQLTPEAAATKTLVAFGLHPAVEVRGGDPADEIVAASRSLGCDLLVMGSRGRSALTGLILGSVSQEVVGRATCPVLLVRATTEPVPSPRSILLALEGEEGAEALVTVTARLARAFEAAVTVAHVSFPGAEALERSLYHARSSHGAEAAASAVARLCKLGITASAMPVVGHRGVTRAIAGCAEEIDAGLIVMGSHGDAEQAARGDLAFDVSHLTKRPVLVTREHGASG